MKCTHIITKKINHFSSNFARSELFLFKISEKGKWTKRKINVDLNSNQLLSHKNSIRLIPTIEEWIAAGNENFIRKNRKWAATLMYFIAHIFNKYTTSIEWIGVTSAHQYIEILLDGNASAKL